MAPHMIEGQYQDFLNRLAQIREEGALILLTGGPDTGPAIDSLSKVLLGEHAGLRHPLFVLIGRDKQIIENRLRSDTTIPPEDILQYYPELEGGLSVRSATATRSPTDETSDRATITGGKDSEIVEPDDMDLDMILNDLNDRIDELTEQDDLSTDDIRVLIDSLYPVIEYNTPREVQAFIDDATDSKKDLQTIVKSNRLMGCVAFVYSLGEVHQFGDWLLNPFDLIIAVRTATDDADYDYECRVELPGESITMDWFQLFEIKEWDPNDEFLNHDAFSTNR